MNLRIFISLITCLFFSFTSLHARSEWKISDFLHAGKIEIKNSLVKIPIEIWNESILLRVKINGKTATFLWDNVFTISGIDNTLIQTYEFRKIDLKDNPSIIDGNNVQLNAKFFACPKVEIKEIKIFDAPFLGINTRVVTQTKKLKVDGVLGASIINKFNWKFNFDKNFVEISIKPFALEKTAIILPFRINPLNNDHLIPIEFNSNIKTECKIDFGYSSDIVGICKNDNFRQIRLYINN